MHPTRFLLLLALLLPLLSSATKQRHLLAKELQSQTLLVELPVKGDAFFDALANAMADEWNFSDLEFVEGMLARPLASEVQTAVLLVDTQRFSPRSASYFSEVSLLVWNPSEQRHVSLASFALPTGMDGGQERLAQHSALAQLAVRYFQHQASWFINTEEAPAAVRITDALSSDNPTADQLLVKQQVLLATTATDDISEFAEAPALQQYALSIQSTSNSEQRAALNSPNQQCIGVLEFNTLVVYRIADGRRLAELTCITDGPTAKDTSRSGNGSQWLDYCCDPFCMDGTALLLEIVCAGIGGTVAVVWDSLNGDDDD